MGIKPEVYLITLDYRISVAYQITVALTAGLSEGLKTWGGTYVVLWWA